MRVLVAAVDHGSLAGAARALNRSPAAVSRAIAFLEHHVGSPLLHRSMRVMRLSSTGEGYARACASMMPNDFLRLCLQERIYWWPCSRGSS
jgi:DNA-binding transcriptional LysR family regulator